MISKKPIVHIIGGGISGLICALELEKHGLEPIILEKEPTLGGRLQTTHFDHHTLDHGFQVLLTAYPAAKRYLNFEKLDLCKFLPGAVICKDKHLYPIGDPLRHPPFITSTISFPAASLKDKWLVLKLVATLKLKSIQKIFRSNEKKTIDFLLDYGFSNTLINDFFRPFFGGIFLEDALLTSSRMFEFVFKMFIEGSAAIPAKGIQEIPKQLEANLVHSTVMLDTTVTQIDERILTLADGRQLKTDYTVLASGHLQLLSSIKLDPILWNKCYNLYFRVTKSIFNKPIIGLISRPGWIINNFHYVNDVQPYTGESIISVTVLDKQKLSRQEIIDKVAQEISLLSLGEQPEFMQLFEIPNALPVLDSLKYKPSADDIRISDRLFQTGDHLCNPSLNGAMESGRATAKLLLASIR